MTSETFHPAILEATQRYIRAQGGVSRFESQVEQVEGNSARVRVSAPGLTPAQVLLKRQGDRWEVVGMGTQFDAAYLQKLGLPASLLRSPAPANGLAKDSFQGKSRKP